MDSADQVFTGGVFRHLCGSRCLSHEGRSSAPPEPAQPVAAPGLSWRGCGGAWVMSQVKEGGAGRCLGITGDKAAKQQACPGPQILGGWTVLSPFPPHPAPAAPFRMEARSWPANCNSGPCAERTLLLSRSVFLPLRVTFTVSGRFVTATVVLLILHRVQLYFQNVICIKKDVHQGKACF